MLETTWELQLRYAEGGERRWIWPQPEKKARKTKEEALLLPLFSSKSFMIFAGQ